MNAWPALQTILYDGWVIRLAGGYTKRANSVNPLLASSLPVDRKIGYCEELFHRHGLPVVFKLTAESRPAGLDATLAARGYDRLDETAVQVLDLADYRPPGAGGFPGFDRPALEWIEAFASLSRLSQDQRQILGRMLGNIKNEAFYALIDLDGRPVGCGLAVLEDGWVGLFDIVVAEEYRGRGLGRQIVQAILSWGKTRGAVHAYLQVVAGNEPAWRLYQKIGFRESYRYWYRRAISPPGHP